MRYIFALCLVVGGLGMAAFAQVAETPCPEIRVEGPPLPTPGEVIKFRAIVTGLSIKPEYKWLISNGRIISGQGTNEIGVVYEINGSNVNVTLEILGIPARCNSQASEMVAPWSPPGVSLFDEYSDLVWKEERIHLEPLKQLIENNPNSQIYFVIYARKRDSGKVKNRISKIKRLIGEDRTHLSFITAIAEEALTRICLVPVGAARPTP